MKRILFVLVIGMFLTVGGFLRANADLGTAYILATNGPYASTSGAWNVVVSSTTVANQWSVNMWADTANKPPSDQTVLKIGFFSTNPLAQQNNYSIDFTGGLPIISATSNVYVNGSNVPNPTISMPGLSSNPVTYADYVKYTTSNLFTNTGDMAFSSLINVSNSSQIKYIAAFTSDGVALQGSAPVVPENATWMLLLLGLLPLGLVLRSRKKGVKRSLPLSTA